MLTLFTFCSLVCQLQPQCGIGPTIRCAYFERLHSGARNARLGMETKGGGGDFLWSPGLLSSLRSLRTIYGFVGHHVLFLAHVYSVFGPGSGRADDSETRMIVLNQRGDSLTADSYEIIWWSW